MPAEFQLQLFILGESPKSLSAIANLRRLCDAELSGRYELEIIDVGQQPELAEAEGILATPTLLKRSPAPVQRIIGDMSHTEKVLLGLGIAPRWSWFTRRNL